VYWIVLFARMRARGRQEFERALDQSAAARAGRDSFEITLSTEIRPLRTAGIVLGVPIALVLIRLFVARGAR
jgi:hypothetical protein